MEAITPAVIAAADAARKRTIKTLQKEANLVHNAVSKSIKGAVSKSMGRGADNVQKNRVGPRSRAPHPSKGTSLVPTDVLPYVQPVATAELANMTNSFTIRDSSSASGWSGRVLRRFGTRLGLTIDGNELLSIVTMPQNAATYGTNLLSINMNPFAWTSTRAQRFSYLFGRYIFSNIEMQIITSLPSATVTGKYLIAYNTDATVEMPNQTQDGYIRMSEMQGAREVSLGLPSTMTCPLIPADQPYYTEESMAGLGDQNVLTNQGKVWIKLGGIPTLSGTVVPPGTELFSVRVKYTLHFMEGEITNGLGEDVTETTANFFISSNPTPQDVNTSAITQVTGFQLPKKNTLYAIFPKANVQVVGYSPVLQAWQSYYCKVTGAGTGTVAAFYPSIDDYLAGTNPVQSNLPNTASSTTAPIPVSWIRIDESELSTPQVSHEESPPKPSQSSRNSIELLELQTRLSKLLSAQND